MHTLTNLRLPFNHDKDLIPLAAEKLGLNPNQIASVEVIKKSLDARGKSKFWVYALNVYLLGESPQPQTLTFKPLTSPVSPPIIVGAGPASLFAAFTLLKHGVKPILIEQGSRMHPRMKAISRFWRTGELDPHTNVCHGEGGAGTFSDGKLITRIKSPLISTVLQTLVDYGAPKEILYVYNPHIGSNKIRTVIQNMVNDLIEQGIDFKFNTVVQALDLYQNQAQGVELESGEKLKSNGVILAPGHSARSLFKTLHRQGVFIEPKSFALGLRIEHPQSYINQWQLGTKTAPEEIRAAQYKLTTHFKKENVGVYSFCMCPGGYVVSSATDPKTLVVNGMSNYHRNSPFANAAVVVSIDKDQIEGHSPFKMMDFQNEIESKVFELSASQSDGKKIPAQRLEDFLNQKHGKPISGTSSPSGAFTTNLTQILPPSLFKYLAEGLLDFEKRRPGFIYKDAVLHAVESRTSSPIRITRNPNTFESLSTKGLFPCGEGPGYAGGITSAAVDGMKAALEWLKQNHWL